MLLTGADITIGTTVVAEAPERFGANIAMADFNNWTSDPSMEGQILRLRAKATGGGTDFILNDEGERTWYWDTIKDGFFDGADVRVYRIVDGDVQLIRTDRVEEYLASDPAQGGRGFRINLAGTGQVIQPGDLYHLDLWLSNARLESVSDRLPWIQTWDTWELIGNGSTERDPSTSAPENGGRSSLKITADDASEVSIRQYRYGSVESTYRQFEPGRTYRMEVWMKQEGVPSGEARFWMNGAYSEVQHTFTNVDESWQKYSFEFSGPDYPTGGGVLQNILGFDGPGTVWVDNLVIYDPTYPPFDVHPEVVDALLDFNPGPVRIWSGQTNGSWGTTLDNWTDPESINQLTWSPNNGKRPAPAFKLPTALPLIEQAGGTPWLIVGPYMNEAEWLGLMEYLAGPAGTTSGDKRIAQGQVNPWTDEFAKIRLELGNETWNPLFSPWNYENGTQYGQFAEYFYSIAKSSPYYPAVADKIEFVLGGWAIQTSGNGYGARAASESPSSSLVGIAGYIGGWEAGYSVGGDEVTDEGFQAQLLFVPQGIQDSTDEHAMTRDAVAGEDVDYDLALYEGGPGYDLPDPGSPFNEVQEIYGKSLAAGVTNLDSYLYRSYQDFGPQCFFLFQPGYNWSSHSTRARGYNAHPSWLSLQMRNRYASGDMVITTATDVPTIDLEESPHYDARPNTPLIQTYAFRDGDKYSIFVLSRRLEGNTPVTLRLPFESAASTTLYRLTGDPRANNIDSLNIDIQEEVAANPTSSDYTFSMPAGSVYLFVFEDTTLVPQPQEPTVTVNQLPGQADPTASPIVQYRVYFNQSVTGFEADDVVVEGTAGAATVEVNEVPGSEGTTYTVTVRDMEQSGTIVVSIPAGAAINSEGYANLASTATDNVVEFQVPLPRNVLLSYDGFSEDPNAGPYAPFLHGLDTGFGWSDSWYAQNFNPDTYGDGYKLDNANPLGYANLATTDAYAVGGRAYETSGRPLDVDGAFSYFKQFGSDPAVVGQGGTTLWASVLLRKETDDDSPLYVRGVDGYWAQMESHGRIAMGYFGASSNYDGQRYWSLQVRNAADDGFDVIRSEVPMTVGEAALLVIKMEFGAKDVFSLYVNPTDLAVDSAGQPDATFATSGKTDVVFRTLGFYGGRGTSQGSMDELRLGDTYAAVTPIPVVRSRHIFYNDSAFDGNDGNANPQDDDAIATDKTALLARETGAFANYTSYEKGINGIMVDIANPAGTPTTADFEFKVGNDNNPAGWSDVSATPTVAVRPGEGFNGSDRVTIVWDDNVIENQWLQVTVLAANLGLAKNDVFYFGNAVGETGNSDSDARVSVVDLLLTRNNPRGILEPAGIDCPYDFNRDGRVNATDVLLARNSQTGFADALKRIDPWGAAAAAEPVAAAEPLAWLEEFFDAEEGRPQRKTLDRVVCELAELSGAGDGW